MELACLGRLGVSWAVSRRLWGVLGRLWSVLGRLWGVLRRLWGVLGRLWDVSGLHIGSPWLPLGTILASFWRPGAPIWSLLGRGAEMSPKFLDF